MLLVTYTRCMEPDTERSATSAPRSTRQRRAVAQAIDGLDRFSSTQSVHERMKAQGESVGLATVYRNLQVMADAGEVDFIRNQHGEMLYRQCGRVHHHHLVCRRCGRAEELAGDAVEQWVTQSAADHGYTQVSHEVEIFGLCQSCSRADRQA